MPWTTPTLKTLRKNARAYIMAALPGADALIPNSVLRVLADVNAGLAHLVLQFIEWLATQLLPITATDIWLDRWATMYLKNSDGSRGRKMASFAGGVVNAQVVSLDGAVIPAGTILTSALGVNYQTIEQASTSVAETVPLNVVALTAGAIGNLDPGTTLGFTTAVTGVLFGATVVTLTGGADVETDAQLQYRLLLRLANPPMGGSAKDYELWALAVPGVTRAWASPEEMGPGTMTIRIMCDSLRAGLNGFPQGVDLQAVTDYTNSVRPVTVKDFFVLAPNGEPIDVTISNLVVDDPTTWSNIEASIKEMLFEKAAPARAVNGIAIPAQTIYAVWLTDAVLSAAGVDSFDISDINGNPLADIVMPNPGAMGVPGDVIHG
jgi:uncharacterized phage protein gp47/JayE